MSENIYGTKIDKQGNLTGTFMSMGWLFPMAAFSTTENNVNLGWWVLSKKSVNLLGQKVYIYVNRKNGHKLVVTDNMH